jgi:hypothetical protein
MGIMRPSPGTAHVNRLANVVVRGIALAACRGSHIGIAKRCVVNTNLRRKRMNVAGTRSIPTSDRPHKNPAAFTEVRHSRQVRLNSLSAT